MFKCPSIRSLVHCSNWSKYLCVTEVIFHSQRPFLPSFRLVSVESQEPHVALDSFLLYAPFHCFHCPIRHLRVVFDYLFSFTFQLITMMFCQFYLLNISWPHSFFSVLMGPLLVWVFLLSCPLTRPSKWMSLSPKLFP